MNNLLTDPNLWDKVLGQWLLQGLPTQEARLLPFLQVILCQINMFCPQLTQNLAPDFVRFTKFYKNCSEIQNLCFEFQNILFESKYIWQNQMLYFGLIGDKNMLIWQRTTCTDMSDIAKTPKERLGPILEGALHQAAKLHLKAGRASKAINRYIKFSYL